MTFNPIILVLLFTGAITIGAFLIYAKIIFDHRVSAFTPSDTNILPQNPQPILISEGFELYHLDPMIPGEPPEYYLDVDDRIIVGIHQPSKHQYAGIRCLLSEELLNNLAARLHSIAAAKTSGKL